MEQSKKIPAFLKNKSDNTFLKKNYIKDFHSDYQFSVTSEMKNEAFGLPDIITRLNENYHAYISYWYAAGEKDALQWIKTCATYQNIIFVLKQGFYSKGIVRLMVKPNSWNRIFFNELDFNSYFDKLFKKNYGIDDIFEEGAIPPSWEDGFVNGVNVFWKEIRVDLNISNTDCFGRVLHYGNHEDCNDSCPDREECKTEANRRQVLLDSVVD